MNSSKDYSQRTYSGSINDVRKSLAGGRGGKTSEVCGPGCCWNGVIPWPRFASDRFLRVPRGKGEEDKTKLSVHEEVGDVRLYFLGKK